MAVVRRWSFVSFVALLTALVIPLLSPASVFAHERRTVAGKYQFVVGFLTEPAFENQTNGLSLRVTVPGENDRPVEGLDQTLKAEVVVGGGAQTMDVPLQAQFGQPGAYSGHFIPTRVGSYIFHFTGTIEGTAIDERFESGPGRFDDVQSIQPLQFPEKLPDQGALARELRAARAEIATTRTLAIVGLVAGVLGLLVGAAALLTRRGSRPTTTR